MRLVSSVLVLLLALALPASNAAADGPTFSSPQGILEEPAGSLLVADFSLNAIVRLDPTTGSVEAVSGCATGIVRTPCTGTPVGSGPEFSGLVDVAREAGGTLIAADFHLGALYRIDPTTGDRTRISGCDSSSVTEPCPGVLLGSGPEMRDIVEIEVASDGTILVADMLLDSVLTVDPVTGDRAVFSGCTEMTLGQCTGAIVGSGPTFEFPYGMALRADGAIVVTDLLLPAVVVIDGSGDRTVVSGCTETDSIGNCTGTFVGTGAELDGPAGVVVEADGSIVISEDALNALVRIDPATGDRTVISGCTAGDGFGNCIGPIVGAGPGFEVPGSMTLRTGGGFAVVDSFEDTVFDVAPVSGDRVKLTPVLEQSVTFLDFGHVTTSTTSSRTFEVSNPGFGELVIEGFEYPSFGTDCDPFTLVHAALPITLASGAATSIQVDFTPTGFRPYRACSIDILNNADFNSRIRLDGVGSGSLEVGVDVQLVSFDQVDPGDSYPWGLVLSNNTVSPQTFALVTSIQLPDGGKIERATPFFLDVGQVRDLPQVLPIPLNAPSGSWVIHVLAIDPVGQTLIDHDFLGFFVR